MSLTGYNTVVVLSFTAPVGGLAQGIVCKCSQFETRLLASTGACRPDRKDFRLLYQGTEIDRIMMTTGSFLFKLQAAIGSGVTCTDYEIDYGKSDEATEPKENPRNVWSSFYDGDDIDDFTITGTVNATDIPKPNFLKIGNNPTLRRTAGSYDEADIREVELIYDNGYFWATYDAVGDTTPESQDGSYCAKSTDLITWQKIATKLSSYVDLIVHKFSGVSGFVGTWGSCASLVDRIPAPPYILRLATSNNIDGPWTDIGVVVPLGSEDEFDDYYTIDGQIFTFDNGENYYLVYGAGAFYYGQSAGLAKSTNGVLGPYSKLGRITPESTSVENPRILDDGSGKFYLIGNLIGGSEIGAYTRSNVLFWSDSFNSYDNDHRTVIIEPGEPGEWDCEVIGVVSTVVIKDGMIYVGYDGSDLSIMRSGRPMDIHKWRDGGFAEARWPLVWGKALTLQSPATAQSPTVIPTSSDGEVWVRTRGAVFGLLGTTESFTLTPVSDGNGNGHYDLSITGSSGTVDGSVVSNGNHHSATVRFKRVSGVLYIYFQNRLIWHGTSSEALSVKVYAGGGVLEEIRSISPSYFGLPFASPSASPSISPSVSPSASPTPSPSFSPADWAIDDLVLNWVLLGMDVVDTFITSLTKEREFESLTTKMGFDSKSVKRTIHNLKWFE